MLETQVISCWQLMNCFMSSNLRELTINDYIKNENENGKKLTAYQILNSRMVFFDIIKKKKRGRIILMP